MDIRQFNETEVAELHNYVRNQVPQSELPRLSLLTENPSKKAQAFIDIYRILSGCKDFSSNEETRNKLQLIMNEYEELYKKLLSLFIDTIEGNTEYSKFYANKELKEVVVENSLMINTMNNSFLVFAEKVELMAIEEVSGVSLDKPEGEEIYKKLIKNI